MKKYGGVEVILHTFIISAVGWRRVVIFTHWAAIPLGIKPR
jgi:hypothetical protein